MTGLDALKATSSPSPAAPTSASAPTLTTFDSAAYLYPTNTAHFQIGGTSPGTGYDQWISTSVISLGRFTDGVDGWGIRAKVGDRFVLLHSQNEVVNTFANVVLPTIPGRALSLIYTATTVEVVVDASPVVDVVLPQRDGVNNLILRLRNIDNYLELVDGDSMQSLLIRRPVRLNASSYAAS